MRKIFTVLITLILPFFYTSMLAQNACDTKKWGWAENIASEPDRLFAKSAYDSDNRLYVAGYFENFLTLGDTTLSSAGNNSYLAKYASDGELLWAKIVEENSRIVDLSIVNDQLFILSTYNDNPDRELWTLSEMNLEGEQLWDYSPEQFDDGLSLRLYADRDGNSYVFGSFEDSIQLESQLLTAEGANEDGFIVKFSDKGEFQWITQVPYFGIYGIASNSKGEIYAVGSSFEPFPFGGELIGLHEEAYAGGFFLKFSATGEPMDYEYVAKAPLYSSLGAVAVDEADNIIVGGAFESTYTSPDDTATTIIGNNRYTLNYSFVAKFNEAHEFLWSDTLTAGGLNTVYDIAVDDIREEYYFAENKLTEHSLLNYGDDGIQNWELMVTDISSTYGTEFNIDLRSDKSAISLTGNYNQPTRFGNTILLPEDSGNAYLAQLELNATLDAPNQPSSKIQVSNLTATSAHIAWENGDGSGRLVLLKKLGKVNSYHIEDGLEYVDGAGVFGSGTQTGEREYVVYFGEGSEITVTGLQPGRPYQVAVIEYNDSISCPGLTNYLQEDVAKKLFLTPGRPKFSIYPNPFSEEVVSIILPDDAVGGDILSLRDAYGRKLVQRRLDKLEVEGNEVKLNMGSLNLPAGIYYLHLTGQTAIRLVKK